MASGTPTHTLHVAMVKPVAFDFCFPQHVQILCGSN